MSHASLILPPGTVLGGYTIEDVLGIGGMAVVYRAVQESLGRRVALKVLNPRLAADTTFRERFRREGAMVAALDHPNVVPVHDLGEADGRLFLAMRLIDGVTLSERLDQGGLTADETLAVLRPIASALDAAHAAGVLHRDVKPQNVLLADDGSVYLADFGVARAASSDLTRTRDFFGSVSYVAPEQIRGEQVGTPADVYAFAVMAHQCLTGVAPFARDTEAGVIHAHLEAPPPPIGDTGDPWAAQVSAAVAGGLAKRPEDRPQAASALVEQIDRALAGVPKAVRGGRPPFPPQLPGHATGIADAGVAAGVVVAASAAPVEAPPLPPAQEPTRFDRRRPELEVAAPRRRRLPLVIAGIVAVLLLGGVAAWAALSAASDAEASVRRLAASGAAARVTRAAHHQEDVVAARIARAKAQARREAAARRKAAARKKAAAAKKRAQQKAAAQGGAGSAGSSSSSGGSVQAAPQTSSGGSSSSSSGSTTRKSSGGGGGSCDFPPC